MRFTRLLLDADAGSPAFEVVCSPRVTVLDLPDDELLRVRRAFVNLYLGNTVFGRAFVDLGAGEEEVGPELLEEVRLRLTGEHHVVGPLSDDTAREPLRPDAAPDTADVALRAGLEVLGGVRATLETATVAVALDAVRGRRSLLRSEVRVTAVEAKRQLDRARSALERIEHMRTAVAAAHERTTEANQRTRRRLSGPISYRRYAKAHDEELALLRTGGFDSYDAFVTYAEQAEADYRAAKDLAATVEAEAEQRDEELADGRGDGDARHLAEQEHLLAARVRHGIGARLGHEDGQRLREALGVVLTARGSGADEHRGELLVRARHALGAVEGRRQRARLAEIATRHAHDHVTLGAVPLVLHRAFLRMTPEATEATLVALDLHLDEVQVIHLGADATVSRWAAEHGAP